jgi:hypothetical protein
MRKKILPAYFKQYRHLLLALPFLLLLYGCPYSSSYKIDTDPTVLADDGFVGKWATVALTDGGTTLPVKMIVAKRNDYEYDLCFTGQLNALQKFNVIKEDSIKATGFISEAANRRFLNLSLKGQYYIAEFIYKNDKITILPLCEHFTMKLVRSNAELRQALELHYKMRRYPLYDDEFCLKEMSRVN